MKQCKSCLAVLPLDSFTSDSQKSDGKCSYCRTCKRRKSNEQAAGHRDHNRERSRRWYQDNQEHAREYRSRPEFKRYRSKYMKVFWEMNPQYRERYFAKNKDHIRATRRKNEAKRLASDLNFRLGKALRSRLRSAIVGNCRGGSAVRHLGCSIAKLRDYLEERFQVGMTWANWGKRGWHIDHIKPLVSFDLSDPEQFMRAAHYTNLQPLWARDNQSKDSRTRKATGNLGIPSEVSP